MKEIITISGKDIELSNNVAWTMEYRDQFGRDIVPALMPIIASVMEGASAILADGTELTIESIAEAIEGRAMEILLPLFQVEFVDVIINITWSMAKAANEDIEPPKRWVRQFEEFPLDVILPAVGRLVVKGFVSSKNLTRLKETADRVRNLQPKSRSTTSSSQESSED